MALRRGTIVKAWPGRRPTDPCRGFVNDCRCCGVAKDGRSFRKEHLEFNPASIGLGPGSTREQCQAVAGRAVTFKVKRSCRRAINVTFAD